MSPVLLAAAGAPTTRLGERLAWTAAMLAVVGLTLLLMRRGWRRRAVRQGDLPAPPPAPAEPGEDLVAPAEATYVASTRAGDWLDRVVVHGLGVRSAAQVHVTPAGVLVERQGAPDVFVPAGALTGVRREKGMAGKFVEEGGLLVLTWQLGDPAAGGTEIDTGLRVRRAAEADAVEDAVARLLATRRVP